MREQVCFEHHVHDNNCFIDRKRIEQELREEFRKDCENGSPGIYGQLRHATIKIDDAWSYCPLCGTRIR